MSRPVRSTPSRRSPSTVCFEGAGWECVESLAATVESRWATTPFVSMSSRKRMSTPGRAWFALGLFVALVALAVVACGTAGGGESHHEPRRSGPTASASAGSQRIC